MLNFVSSYHFGGFKTAWGVLALILALLLIDTPAHAAKNQKSHSSLCLEPSDIQQAAKSNGILDSSNPDHNAKSLTSTNNFIHICRKAKLTNGGQLKEGSCNPTPMGFIPSDANMPSVRIIRPLPDTVISPGKEFDVEISVDKIELGSFTNPKLTYYLAPQQLNKNNQIRGHLHVVFQKVVDQGVFDTREHVFFKGITDRQVNGKVKTTVTGGLPAGNYRIATITSAMNHQPVLLPVAARGAVDDAIYIRVGSTGRSSEKIVQNNPSSTPGGGGAVKSKDVSDGGYSEHPEEAQSGKGKKKHNRK